MRISTAVYRFAFEFQLSSVYSLVINEEEFGLRLSHKRVTHIHFEHNNKIKQNTLSHMSFSGRNEKCVAYQTKDCSSE